MHMKSTTERGLRAISGPTMARLQALAEQLQDLEIEVLCGRMDGGGGGQAKPRHKACMKHAWQRGPTLAEPQPLPLRAWPGLAC